MIPDNLIDTTAFMFGVERKALLGSSRVARVAEARQALAWALRQSDWSLESIGALLHRDHTTIIHAVMVIERKASRDQRLRERLAVLTEEAIVPVSLDLRSRVVDLEARVAQLEKMLAEYEV